MSQTPDQVAFTGEEQLLETQKPESQPCRIQPQTPIELCDMIFDLFITFPASVDIEPPPFFPLLFPRNPQQPKIKTYSLATCHRTFLSLVAVKFWKLIVITKDSHLDNLLRHPIAPAGTGPYLSTTHCHIFLPFDAACRDYDVFFRSFPNLTTVIWEYPPFEFFDAWDSVSCPVVTHLQIGSLPPGFNLSAIARLSTTFPSLTTLQIQDTPGLSPRNTWHHSTEPLLPNLQRLAVGTPRNFLPGEPFHSNNFLQLLSRLPTDSVCPLLNHLAVEDHCDSVQDFLLRHGSSLRSLSYSTQNKLLFREPLAFVSCINLEEVVLKLDVDTLPFPVLPDNIERLVVLQPFLPAWMAAPRMSIHLQRCLDRIFTIPDINITTVMCENRNEVSSWRVAAEEARFASVGVNFSTFDFGEA